MSKNDAGNPLFGFDIAMIRLSEWRPKMCFEFPEREYHRVFKRKGTTQKSRMEVNSTRRPVSSCFASCFAPFPLLSSCFGQKCVLFVLFASCFRPVLPFFLYSRPVLVKMRPVLSLFPNAIPKYPSPPGLCYSIRQSENPALEHCTCPIEARAS